MSLINEALRKARKEAGEKNGVRLEVSASARRPGGGGVGTTLVLGALIAAIAAIGGAVAVWWLLADQQPSAIHTAGTETPNRDDQTEFTAETPDETDIPPAVEGGHSEVVPEISNPVDHMPATITTQTGATPSAGLEFGDEKPDEEEIGEATPNPTPQIHETREYIAEADVRGTSLVLDYIVYRASDPYAEINGLEVHVGSHIEEFVVEEITRDIVRLSDENGELILRAR